jgi:PTS hybrid protein
MEAIESVADTDHVLVMMDIGSALLRRNRAGSPRSGDCGEGSPVRRAAGGRDAGGDVSAAAGAGIDKVIADAMNALEANAYSWGYHRNRNTLRWPPRRPTTATRARFPW